MKRVLTMLGVIGVTALITFLWVTKNQSEERTRQLNKSLAEAEGRIAQLESDIDLVNQRVAYLSEHRRPQAVPASHPTSTLQPASEGAAMPAPAVNLISETSHQTTVQPLALPIPIGVWGSPAGPTRFGARSGSFVRIEGTSSIHDWRAESPFIGGSGVFDFESLASPNGATNAVITNVSASVFILVGSLKSTEQNGRPYSDKMDSIMFEKLRGTAYPRIIFTLDSLKPMEDSQDGGVVFNFNARGKLAVAGVTNSISLPITATPQPDGKIQFSGTTSLRMSDFKIEMRSSNILPIKVGDEVKVSFVWNVGPTGALQAKNSR